MALSHHVFRKLREWFVLPVGEIHVDALCIVAQRVGLEGLAGRQVIGKSLPQSNSPGLLFFFKSIRVFAIGHHSKKALCFFSGLLRSENSMLADSYTAGLATNFGFRNVGLARGTNPDAKPF